MVHTYRFADRIVRIASIYELIHNMCREYRLPDPGGDVDISAAASAADIELERERSAREDIAEGREPRQYPDEYLETLAVYRQIAERMPAYDTFLFHGSAVAVDGEAYLFTAKSGTGKSTHTRLWRQLLGSRAVMVNDDKPLIHVGEDGAATVYGTPWDGKHHLSSNIAVPLRAVCVLERSQDNHISCITKSDAMPMLMQQSYRPSDPEALMKTLRLIDRMNIQLWRLGCNMDPAAARLSYNTMKEG